MSIYAESTNTIQSWGPDEDGPAVVHRPNDRRRPGQPTHRWQTEGHEPTADLLVAVCQAAGQPVPDRPAEPPLWEPEVPVGGVGGYHLVLWRGGQRVARVGNTGAWEVRRADGQSVDELDTLADAIQRAELLGEVGQ